jgi:hypothetical protein|tara:strand:+ start:384 stop:485 length:102 start_codon:yes stop_codon:yes gene_type:complete
MIIANEVKIPKNTEGLKFDDNKIKNPMTIVDDV